MSNVPDIRFKGFTDAWEQREFNELLKKDDGVRRGPFGSALKKEIFVKESEYVVYEQQNAIYDKYDTRYNITKEKYEELNKFKVEPGDFIMSGAGTIGRVSFVPKGIKSGVFNQALIRFRINNRIMDPLYFLQFLRNERTQKLLTSTNPGSAMTNLLPLTELKKWKVTVPIVEEQKLIGEFLRNYDNTITLLQRKIDNIKKVKKGLLQKLFPLEQSINPQVRFSGFNQDWEQRELGKVVEFFSGLTYSPDNIIDETGTLVLRSSNVSDGAIINYNNVYVNTECVNSINVLQGDIIVVVRNGSKSLIGKHAVIKNEMKDTVIGAFMTGIRSNYYQFINALLDTEKFKQEIDKNLGATINQITTGNFKKMKFIFPNNEEMKKIGNVFEELDNTITLLQKELEMNKQVKKGFLQKLFPKE